LAIAIGNCTLDVRRKIRYNFKTLRPADCRGFRVLSLPVPHPNGGLKTLFAEKEMRIWII
jgi:hypothetical protein